MIRGKKMIDMTMLVPRRPGRVLWQRTLAAMSLMLAMGAHALVAMDDAELSSQTGGGIAIALQDIEFLMAPTSYIEATPSTTNLPSGAYAADLRWYGLSMTGDGNTGNGNAGSATGSTQWNGACAPISGSGNICPLGTTPVVDFASVYNPFVLRVFNYAGYDAAGVDLTDGSSGTAPTVLELRGPTASDSWRWAFWGALTVNASTSGPQPIGSAPATGTCPNTLGNTTYCGLQSQTIIDGKPIAMVDTTYGNYATATATPTVFQIFQMPAVTDNYGTGDVTMGIVYDSALSGAWRNQYQCHHGAKL